MVLVYLVAQRGWRAGPNCQGWIIDKKRSPSTGSGNRARNLQLERQNMPTGLALLAVIYGLLSLFNPSYRSKSSSSSSGRGPVRKIWPWWLPRLCAPTRRRRRRGDTNSPVQPPCAGRRVPRRTGALPPLSTKSSTGTSGGEARRSRRCSRNAPEASPSLTGPPPAADTGSVPTAVAGFDRRN
jgi:hypothetical protein